LRLDFTASGGSCQSIDRGTIPEQGSRISAKAYIGVPSVILSRCPSPALPQTRPFQSAHPATSVAGAASG